MFEKYDIDIKTGLCLYSKYTIKSENITLRNKVLNMEQEKEYNDFIALGRKCYPKQDDKGITNFNSVVLDNVYPKKIDILDNYGVTKCELLL